MALFKVCPTGWREVGRQGNWKICEPPPGEVGITSSPPVSGAGISPEGCSLANLSQRALQTPEGQEALARWTRGEITDCQFKAIIDDIEARISTQTIQPEGKCPEGVPARICQQPCENFLWDDELIKRWQAYRTYGGHPCNFYKEAVSKGKYRVVTPPPELTPPPPGGTWQEQLFRTSVEITRQMISVAAACIAGGFIGRPCVVPELKNVGDFVSWLNTIGATAAAQFFGLAHDAFLSGDIGRALKYTFQGACQAGLTPNQVCQFLRDQGLEIENCEQIVQALCEGKDLPDLKIPFPIGDGGGGEVTCSPGEVPIEVRLGSQTMTVCAKLKDGFGPGPQIPKELLYLGGGLLALMALAIVFKN